VILWRGRSAPPLSVRGGNRPLEPADVALGPEAVRDVEHAEQDGREVTADAGDGAQDILGLKLGMERLDPAVKLGAGGDVGAHDVDLDGDFRLKQGSSSSSPRHRTWPAIDTCRSPHRLNQFVRVTPPISPGPRTAA
jgi:hypothetical protein